MSSKAWSIVGNIASVETLATAAVTGAAAHFYHVGCDNAGSALEKCRLELENIKTRINELSPDRRERLRIAAEQGKCSSIAKLEHKLQE